MTRNCKGFAFNKSYPTFSRTGIELRLQSLAMPKKKKPGTFSISKAVKANARAVVGTPKSTTAIPDAKSKQEHKAAKHKKTLGDLIAED